MRYKFLAMTTLTFALVLWLACLSHGTGVVKCDLSRYIFILAELTMPLQVKAAHDGKKEIYFRYRWPALEPDIYHDMLKYQASEWLRVGTSAPGRSRPIEY